MKRKTKWIVTGTLTLAVFGGGAGIALAAADNDHAPITGPALERATAVALEHVGGGRVTETEEGDEEGYYQVEVTRADGSQIDVNLGRDFGVLAAKADDEKAG